MIFNVLLNQISTIFLSLNLLTTLSFDSEVVNYLYGGSKEEIFIEVTNGSKTLALKPRSEQVESNLLVITKTGKYYFNVRYDAKNSHQFVEVKDGQINHAMKEVLKNDDYEIREGMSSLLFVNLKKQEVDVNGVKVARQGYFSKGVPIILEGKRIFN